MAKTVELKPEDVFARSYVDRLILEKLTEMDAVAKVGELAERLAPAGVGLSVVRTMLASNPAHFAYHERRWIPATRLSAVGRPLSEAMYDVVGGGGGPMPLDLLVTELSRIRRMSVEALAPIVARKLALEPRFVVDAERRVGLIEWSFVATDETTARGYALNRVSVESVVDIQAKLGEFDYRAPGAAIEAIARLAPVSLKALGAAFWSALNPQSPTSVLLYDAAEFYRAAIVAPGVVLAPDGVLYPEAEARKWINSAVKLADRLATTIEAEDAAPLELKGADSAKLAKRIADTQGGITATRLLEENYEITPGNRTFPDDLANMIAALGQEKAIVWVGGDRFVKAGSAPDVIESVPEPFQFQASGVLDDEGELVDVELTDDGLSSTLRKLLSHPLATDVLDEDPQPAPKTMPDTLRLVLKSIHRELGTFPLCQVPTGWLDAEPNIQELLVVDPNGRELEVWANVQDRLTYNWVEWWYEQPIESGAVFTLTKTPKPNVFEFVWMDQPDPVIYISSQRMEELRTIGLEGEGKSTLDLLVQVMAHWPKGADYLSLLAEVNVVRRSSRRLIASLLSSYQAFYQRSGSPVWHFDPKKLDLGFDKTKRKFVRK